MKQLIKLSPLQEKVVNHSNGALLVKASAGSGKTRVLTERIKRIAGTTKRKILAITFTNKAGEEMKNRLGNDNSIQDKVFIGTFHSFCQQVLEIRGNLIGLDKMPHIFEETSDRIQLIGDAIINTPSFYSKFKNLDNKKQQNFKYKALDFISKAKRELLSESELFLQTNNEDLVLLYHNYQEILTTQNAIDFDDLIMLTYQLFTNNPKVAALYQRTYKYICVDEAQDLNNAQYQLLKTIIDNDHHNVIMVGDPNQSIFAFNGSSSDYMTKNFVNDFQPLVIELSENFRSSRKVIEAAEKIIKGHNEIVNMTLPGIFETYSAEDEEDEVNFVVSNICQLIELRNHDEIEGGIKYEKIAILARNRYVFGNLTSKLDEDNIPYYFKITAGSIKFESIVMKAFDLALRIKLNPNDTLHWVRLKEVLNVNNSSNIDCLINNINEIYLVKMLLLVQDLKVDGSNLKSSINKYVEYIKSTNEIKDPDEKNLILNELNELIDHWHQYAKRSNQKSIHQFKNAMALGQTHPNTQPKGITLSTVHTMKGQEYDIVFLIGVDDGTFPDYRAINSGGIELTQEKNNTYVAFTRAKRFLYVSYPKQRIMPWGDVRPREVSRFLKELF